MAQSETTEGNASSTEQPLKPQLAQEARMMISKLRDLKLDEPSSPGMIIIGGRDNLTAIFLGKVSATGGKSHLVISPEGFFLAEPNDPAFEAIRKQQQQAVRTLIDEKVGSLDIMNIGNNISLGRLSIKRVDSDPEQFQILLKSAIESSRILTQKPLLDEIARAKAGNSMLDAMIQQEKPPSPQPPSNPGPTV